MKFMREIVKVKLCSFHSVVEWLYWNHYLNKSTFEDKIIKYFPLTLTFLNIYQYSKSFLETLEQTLLKQTESESSTLL